jgi:hypothetical protein
MTYPRFRRICDRSVADSRSARREKIEAGDQRELRPTAVLRSPTDGYNSEGRGWRGAARGLAAL